MQHVLPGIRPPQAVAPPSPSGNQGIGSWIRTCFLQYLLFKDAKGTDRGGFKSSFLVKVNNYFTPNKVQL